MSLWVLLVAKEKLGIKKMTAGEVASIIRDVMEVSVNSTTIGKSLGAAGHKIHAYHEGGETLFEIMRAGKEHLTSLTIKDRIEAFYFEPGKRYTSKKLLRDAILRSLKGELRIVDPYCGERTLDVLKDSRNTSVKFLTKIEKLQEKVKDQFLRDLHDFKTEYPNIEFRNYTHDDIHDRYIVSQDCLVILGHSIKDLGSKESFAIVLDKAANRNIVDALSENFDRRWNQSTIL